MQAVCVYCGSAFGTRDTYREAATALGQALAAAGITLVYGGGRVGLMGRIADAVLAAGGRAIGVIPQLLVDREVAHTGLSELHVVADMHERKRMMADLCDGFIAMPGGAGTLEELFEVYTWAQLGYHNKPIGLLNVAGFYDPLLAMLRHTAQEGFLRESFVDLLVVENQVPALLAALRERKPVTIDKWARHHDAV
ncbi:TIGR00730 family Rossman fold protein [Robbsia sp. Bb-Pol-6]|uniref:Cytokinin riboside 5'-monophosphate phosphoribohydrolase n=1 Tax=Robbsia betulipollinis TaxID=2981849 RepID=A0ABT3ZMG1_9BURK|nr:TIGR00730 family Rossman fold protein [Robbsia betulipollinis]